MLFKSFFNDSAPQGCVQYFMEPTGTFTSYGYQNSQMLANQLYATCFRRNLGKISGVKITNNFFIFGNKTKLLGR